jgi:phosphoglycerate dehydrogenase-like enzyme
MTDDTRSSTSGGRDVILVADPIHPAGIERLGEKFDLVLPGQAIEEDMRSRITAVVVRTFKLSDTWMDGFPSLRLIAKHGSGVDNIDIGAATRRGIIVANTPGGTNSTAVAEGAVTLMLAVLRRVREMDACVRDNRFDQRWRLQLGDLTLGELTLVGFGQIAKAVARICGSGFQMRVRAYDPFVSAQAMESLGVEKVDDLAKAMDADVVSIHTPLSEKTRHLVGARELAAMRPNSILVNTSRGGLVDEAALAHALEEGKLLGAGIDVFEQEPPPPENPLLRLQNVVLSPHVAGVTSGSMKGMALAVCDVIDVVVSGGRPSTLLNPGAFGERQ